MRGFIVLASVTLAVLGASPGRGDTSEPATLYSNPEIHAVVVGRIVGHRLIELNEDAFAANRYDVDVQVIRIVSGNDFEVEEFTTEIRSYDAEYTQRRNMVFVFEKADGWRVVAWHPLSDLLCLDEQRLESEGWTALSTNRLSDVCMVLENPRPLANSAAQD